MILCSFVLDTRAYINCLHGKKSCVFLKTSGMLGTKESVKICRSRFLGKLYVELKQYEVIFSAGFVLVLNR